MSVVSGSDQNYQNSAVINQLADVGIWKVGSVGVDSEPVLMCDSVLT
jgi:hypothetical protein